MQRGLVVWVLYESISYHSSHPQPTQPTFALGYMNDRMGWLYWYLVYKSTKKENHAAKVESYHNCINCHVVKIHLMFFSVPFL